jgi:hypothetical protein
MTDQRDHVGLAEAPVAFDPPSALDRRKEGQPLHDPETQPIRNGEVDPLGDTVSRIRVDTDSFTIYSIDCDEDEIRRPRYYLKGTYATAEQLRQRLNVVSGAMNRINDVIVGMRPDSLTLPFYRRQYRSLVERAREHQAQAMQQAFEGHASDALQLLTEFRLEVESCRDSRNKMRYILANAVSVLIVLALWYGLRDPGPTPGIIGALMANPIAIGGEATVRLVDMLALGAIGAFFSVSIGINALKINSSITIPEMIYAGFIRILIGVIGAGVVFLLILGGWMLTAIDAQYQLWSYALFAFLAGFSEALVPNALKRAEDSSSVTVPTAAPARPPAPPPSPPEA